MTEEIVENPSPSLPGAELRAQRERKGLSIAQAASELHVDKRLLQALEEDRFADIGAPIFVKGHLRNYARLLGLDAAEMVRQYEASQHPADPGLVANRPEGTRMDQARSHAWVGWLGWLFLLLLAVLLGGWWYYQQEGGGELVISPTPERAPFSTRVEQPAVEDRQATEPELPAAESEQTERALTETPAEDEVAPAEERRLEEDSVAAPQMVAPAPREDAPAQQARRELPETAPPRAATPSAGQGLVLEFSQESWVEIYDAEGRPILYDLMTPGTRREINAAGELRVFLGNADGVEVTVGGEEFDLARYRRRDSTARFTVNVPAAD